MDKLDRMELADIGHPRKMAEAVIKQIPGVVYPFPIEDVAHALGILAIDEFDTDKFEGALLTNDTKATGSILVRRGVLPTRRRFTVGHELGHFLMPLHFPSAGGFKCTKADMRADEKKGVIGKPTWEAQANAFASEVLMPSTEFRRQLREGGGASIETLIAMGDAFGVSRLAAGMTMLRLADDPIALVSARNGVIEKVFRSKEFPVVSLMHGRPIPRESMALRKGQNDGTVSEIDDIDPCHWFSKDIDGAELVEQVLHQSDGWTLTLLTATIPEEDD